MMSSCKYRGQTGCPQDFSTFSLPFFQYGQMSSFSSCIWLSCVPGVPFLPNAHNLSPSNVSLSSPPLFLLCGQLDQSWVSVVPTSAGIFGVSRLYLAALYHAVPLQLQAGIYYDYWDPRNYTKFLVYTQPTGHQNPLKWRFRPRPRKYLAYFFRTLLKNRDSFSEVWSSWVLSSLQRGFLADSCPAQLLLHTHEQCCLWSQLSSHDHS